MNPEELETIVELALTMLEEKVKSDMEERDKLLLEHGEILAEQKSVQQVSSKQTDLAIDEVKGVQQVSSKRVESLEKSIESNKKRIKSFKSGLTKVQVEEIVKSALPKPVEQKEYEVKGKDGIKVESKEEDNTKTFTISLVDEDGKTYGVNQLVGGTRNVLGANNRGVWARKVRVADEAGNFVSKQLEEILVEIADSLVAQNEFIEMTDTPAAYAGGANKFAMVNAGEDAIEFSDGATVLNARYLKLDASNGPITGNLTINADLAVTGDVTIRDRDVIRYQFMLSS